MLTSLIDGFLSLLNSNAWLKFPISVILSENSATGGIHFGQVLLAIDILTNSEHLRRFSNSDRCIVLKALEKVECYCFSETVRKQIILIYCIQHTNKEFFFFSHFEELTNPRKKQADYTDLQGINQIALEEAKERGKHLSQNVKFLRKICSLSTSWIISVFCRTRNIWSSLSIILFKSHRVILCEASRLFHILNSYKPTPAYRKTKVCNLSFPSHHKHNS